MSGARDVPMESATRQKAIRANYPWYPPPVYPEGAEIRGGYAGFNTVGLSYADERTDKGIVQRRNLRMGDITRYTYGHVVNPRFRVISTGTVESSKFQPATHMPHVVQLNTFLYRANKGYPYNLGLSEKVPTIPNEALNGMNAGTMTPRPRYTRNIFTNRNYGTVRGVPAKPSQGI